MNNINGLNTAPPIINLGILAHVDAGKTTLTEGLLVHSGVKRAMGRVDDGTTTTDSMALERRRGITIRAATVSFHWQGTKINLIDTPGHMDFIAEVERSLAVLDGVVLLISAKEGVQTQTRVIFAKLAQMGIPTLLFINKVDRAGVSLPWLYQQIREKLTPHALPMQAVENPGNREASLQPLDLCVGALHETIVAVSDALLADYLAGRPIPAAACMHTLRAATRGGRIFPMYHGSALHDLGIAELLTAIPLFFRAGGDAQAPLSAMAYKLDRDESGRKRLYLRVFSGTMRVRDRVDIPGNELMQIKALFALREGRIVNTDSLAAGDIGILPDIADLRCGDFLGAPTDRKLPPVPPPLLIAAIAPADAAQRPALLDALTQLTEEDPALQLRIDGASAEITLRLYGPLQREIIGALLLERFGLAVSFSPLATLFKEQPAQSTFAEMRLGAPGNFHAAGIALTAEPLPPGSGNRYVSRVSVGHLMRTFQTAVEDGVAFGLTEGLGHEITDTLVTFTDMDFSSVTSTPADFRRLAPEVLRKALRAVPLRRMEPWLSFALIAPAAFQKRALAALSPLRAVLGSTVYTDAECTIQGEIPLDTAKDFAAELASMTQGCGLFQTTFLDYRQA